MTLTCKPWLQGHEVPLAFEGMRASHLQQASVLQKGQLTQGMHCLVLI